MKTSNQMTDEQFRALVEAQARKLIAEHEALTPRQQIQRALHARRYGALEARKTRRGAEARSAAKARHAALI